MSGAAVAKALDELGYSYTEVDVGYDVAGVLAKLKPDIAFNALHGTYGEDGCIQGLLEFLRIPYTHSGVRASAVAMHKPTAKIMFESAGISCAPGKVVSREEVLAGDVMERPYVVKPSEEGSSVGVTIVTGDNFHFTKENLPEHNELLVEKYIEGRELSVAVADGKALGVVEISPKEGFYDYRNKYTSGNTEYLLPAPVEKAIYDKAMEYTEKAHNILQCRGISRADLRYDEKNGRLYMLEINTHPGFTPTSLVPKIAEYAGTTFNELVDMLVKSAKCDN